MKRGSVYVVFLLMTLAACATTYKATPLSFKSPEKYPNAQKVAGATVGSVAFVDEGEAKDAFGFDVRGAGMLPVQVVFDNQGTHPLAINPAQTFLEDGDGNLWPVLSSDLAYERAARYTRTKEVFREGAYHGFLGAAAGAVIGAAIGIVTGDNVAGTIGKGAAVGGAAGATLGGVKGYVTSDDARRAVVNDLQQKSLQAKTIAPGDLAFGFIFFPGEVQAATQLRLQVIERDTGVAHVLLMKLD